MPKAYVFTAHGGPEVESFTELPLPTAGEGQLLVAVRAAGVNPVDWKRRAGLVPAPPGAGGFPTVLGNEVAGVVERVGPGAVGFAVGDAVFASTSSGGYARYTLVQAALTAGKPDALAFTDAATLPVAAGTAYDGVRQLALPEGATLLVNGVGGGVGVAAAQIARHFGVRVLGTAGAAKKKFVESLGAVHLASGPGVAERVGAAAPDGVDGILDLVGGDALEAVAGLLKDPAKLVTAADPATAARLGGSVVERDRSGAVLAALAELAVSGALRPFVTQVFPFARAGQALRTVEDGHARGKIVIEVGS